MVLGSQDTPLHPPSGRGDKKLRQANKKPRVEYWRELLAYVDAAYREKFGRHYAWNNLVRKNLWNLARGYSSWEVMALWDVYLAGESWWASRTGWSVYGMIRDGGRLMDDTRFKQLAVKHEEDLARHRFGSRNETSSVFASLFLRNACKLRFQEDACVPQLNRDPNSGSHRPPPKGPRKKVVVENCEPCEVSIES